MAIHPKAKKRKVEDVEAELDVSAREFLDGVCVWIPEWSKHPLGHWQSRCYDKAKAAAKRFGVPPSEFARVAFKLATSTYCQSA